MSKKQTANKLVSFLAPLLVLTLLINIGLFVQIPLLRGEQVGALSVVPDSHGITVTLAGEFELYFNATNGAEITVYYDLRSDPYMNNNLVLPSNLSIQPPGGQTNLSPLFESGLYAKTWPMLQVDSSTGGDPNATLTILGSGTQNGFDYVILQATARIMDAGGGVFKDAHGNTIYVYSTWLIRSDGKMFVERTLYVPDYVLMPATYNWYPFYCIRKDGFDTTATYFFFNTSYAYTYTVSRQTYRHNWTAFPEMPSDNTGYFGIAAPFSNTSLGADGTHNIVLVYDLGLSSISEWKSDTFQCDQSGYGGDEFGATHQFTSDNSMTTQTYHTMIVLTHDPISEQSVSSFADYFSKNQVFPLVKPSLTANKVFYEFGEPFIVNVSATFDYNMINLNKALTFADKSGRVLWREDYGIVNVSQGETWSSIPLLNQTLSAIIASNDYTFTFSLASAEGVAVGSDNVSVIVSVGARQFGKTDVGKQNATSYRDYKMICRYLLPEDGWVTSIFMWFGTQGFEAKVAIYTHPEGRLVVQSQSEPITSIGWHNFTLPRTLLISGFYGLAWKNSQDATTAFDPGLSDQTARTPELYSYSFSSTFGTPQFFPVATSIFATYDPIAAKMGLSSYPQTPSYDEKVTVTAHATDGGILTGPAILSYSTSEDNRNWVNVDMMPDEGLFTAEIPPHKYNTVVYYKATAQDARGEPISSGTNSYQVVDSQPPTISYVGQTPVSPNYNETVIVSANVSEPLDASGIKSVTLSFWNGSAWTDMTMALENNLYSATIPELPFETIVNYTVSASDDAQNTAVLDIYSYEVVDVFPPVAKIGGLTQTSLKGVVPVNVTGGDANFDHMELHISGQLVQSWSESSSEVYYWDTTKYPDGTCLVKLVVYDKANNAGEQETLVNISNVGPGWTLSLIAAIGLIVAASIGTWAYSARRMKEKGLRTSTLFLRINNRAVKLFVRLALVVPAVWYGFWIMAEALVWHKPFGAVLATSPINAFGFALALLLLVLFEVLLGRQPVESAKLEGSRLKNAAVKLAVRLAIILTAVWCGFWIAAEVIVWNKPLANALATSLINDLGFALATSLFLLFEAVRRRQRTKPSVLTT